MTRMLGRYQTKGCCTGMREGWRRTRRMTGLDCFGADSDTRSRKTVERREMQREFDRWLPHAADRLDPLDDPSDCQHGCNGDCERWGGEECTWLCHPEDLAERVQQWAERTGHCDPADEPDLGLVRAHLDRWAAARTT